MRQRFNADTRGERRYCCWVVSAFVAKNVDAFDANQLKRFCVSRNRAAFERASAYEETARAVIALREALGLTQEALADRTGTTASAISRLERGEHSPNLETLRKIAHACGGELRLEFHVPGHPSHELVATL